VHPTVLYEQIAEPVRIMDEIVPKQITAREDGTYMVDMGQNMAGWLELTIDGEPGQEITILCTEVLDKEGNLDPSSTGIKATKVIQTLKYTCHGQGVEVWQPQFTYFGFRYAQVSGLNAPPKKDFIKGKVLYSAVKVVGEFECSEKNINKLHELSRWTILGNIHGIPTDCPHREKCGWTGDSHAMILPMIYNWDSQRFFEKYMFDMRSSARVELKQLYFGKDFHDRSVIMKPKGIPTMIVPGKRTSGIASPDWGTAMVQIPWILYVYYGDQVILESFYSDMQVWVNYIEGIKDDGIIPHGLGDWCPPGGNNNKDCPVPISSSAFHILDVSIMAQAAKLLGNDEDHRHYTTLLKQLKADFNRHFFDPETQSYGSSQTANILALDMEIVPEDQTKPVAAAILKNIQEQYDGFLNTGIFGLARVFKVLAENGYEQDVYRLLTKTGKNSFAYMWDEYDATTLWEKLPTGDSLPAGSMNHPMQAGYAAWFYSGIAGINPNLEAPGFQQIVFKPYLTRQLESVSAQYDAQYGRIGSAWQRKEDRMIWRISIPANSQGQIWVPTYGNTATIQVNGNAVPVIEQDAGFSLIGTFDSGNYKVQW
jgi:alpha-L-rhamnosidase